MRQPDPFEIEVLPGGILVIDGLKFSRKFFEVLSDPDPKTLYRIVKRPEDDVVTFETVPYDPNLVRPESRL